MIASRTLLVLASLVIVGCSDSSQESLIVFGDAPIDEPRIFAPGVVSTEDFEFALTISPELDELYFTRREQGEQNKIFCMTYDRGKWSNPFLAPFSNSTMDFEPHFSPTGKKLFFGSLRPVKGEPGLRQWYLERLDEGWKEPKVLEAHLGGEGSLMYVSATENENLYFTGIGLGARSGIFFAENQGDTYGPAERLEEGINQHDDVVVAHPFIAPDESYLLFDFEGPAGYGSCDLYISFRQADGSWTEAENLGSFINSEQCEMCASVSPDGNNLFFHRGNDDDVGDVYWIDFETALASRRLP